MERNFMDLSQAKWREEKFLCVGPDIDYAPFISASSEAGRITALTEAIDRIQSTIEQTKDIVCAYKPNSAFYEAFGEFGFKLLHDTIAYCNKVAPDVPVILDAKRADIGKTNQGYVAAAFGTAGFVADAITVHPYLGSEAMKPFLDQKNKGIIVLCKTSNPGAGEFQDIDVHTDYGFVPFYEVVARCVANTWNYNGNCLVVAGATWPKELAAIRKIIGNMPILIPGVGTQGGDVVKTVEAGLNDFGTGIIINSSSGIMYAANPRQAALDLHEQILAAREKVLKYRAERV